MSIKQYIGKKSYNSIFNSKDFGFSALLSAGVGVFALLPGLIISESLPMDDSPKEGAVIAIEQYHDVITYLDKNDPRNQDTEIPIGLTEVMNEAGHIGEPNQLNEQNAELSEWLTSAKKVGTSLILDNRLNEVQKRDLFEAFESSVADFNEVTGLATPDFADIDEAIAATPEYTNEYRKAQSVIKSSRDDALNPSVMIGTGATTSLFFLSLFLIVSMNSRRLLAWKMEEPVKPTKKLKYKH